MPDASPPLAAIRTFAVREGPAVLARLDDRWMRTRRRAALERCLSAAIALAGLSWFGWPAAPMAVLLLLGAGASIVLDAVFWWHHADAIQAARNDQRHAVEVEAALQALVDGTPPAEAPATAGVIPGPGLELAIAAWIYLCMLASLLWEIREVTGVSLVQAALAAPDMLILMTLVLMWQVASIVTRARRNDAVELEADAYAPLLDAIVWIIAIFCWMVIGAVCEALAGFDGLAVLAGQGIVVLVVACHCVFFLRGALELHLLGLRRHALAAARRWLDRCAA